MRVIGFNGKRPLHLLLDSGSTYNFLDRVVASQLGCEIQIGAQMKVTVADDSQMNCCE